MTEMKRLELTTVSTSQKPKKATQKQQTYRFNLVIGESTSTTCPEYSFVDFVKCEKRYVGDPFDEPDEQSEVAAIAQRFEAKYGPKGLQSGTKKRTQEMDDFYDPGGGYDEDDPFIDNTEAYDEVIPASLTTQHGGFYINQGRLDFIILNEDSWDPLKSGPKKKKVRVLEPESEDETGITLAKKCNSMKRKKQLESREPADKKKLSDPEEGEKIRQKKKLKLKQTEADYPPKNDVINPSLLPHVTPTSAPTSTTNASAVSNFNKGITETATNGTADVKNETATKDEFNAFEETFNAVLREALNEDSSSKSGEDGKGDNQSAERNTPLPSQLPPELLEAIENMKREAKETKEKKFFSAYINKLLLDIEIGSHKLPWGSKTAIYSHLSEHLPYGKYTLQRRAKKLRESQEEDQLKGPILKLKEAIRKVMPALEGQHEMDVQKAKMNAEAKEDLAEAKEDLADAVKEEMSTESEGEEKSDNRKKPRGPRRKFQWNTEIREMLLGIVSTRMKHYSSCRTRSQTAEEYLKAYLDSDIKPLWPTGWMQTRILFKESRKAHEDLTKGILQGGKPKKVPAGVDTAPTTETTKKVAAGVDTAPTTETTHVSRTEDVIEVSSIMENADKNKKTVVVNLPNSVASMSQVYPTSVSSTSVTSAEFGKESFKVSIAAGQVTQISLSSVSPSVQQKAVAFSNLPGQDVVAVSLTDTPRMSSSQRSDGGKSLNAGFSQETTLASGGQGSSLALPSAPSSGNTSLVLEALDELNNNGSTKLDPSSLQQQQLRTNIQQRSSNQHVLVMPQKTVPHQQQMGNIKQEKILPQELQDATNSQQFRAVGRASPNKGLTKDAPNSSWANVGSVVPSTKLVNPVVGVNRIPENTTQKRAPVVKNNSAAMQPNKILPPNQQQLKILNPSAKSNQNTVQKKQHLGNGAGSPGIVSTNSEAQLISRAGVVPVNTVMSSKEDSGKQTLLQQDFHKKSGQSNTQLKAVTSTSNSVPKFSSQQSQNIKTGTVIGTGASLHFNSRTAADFSGWISNKAGNIKQMSPSVKTVVPPTSIARSFPAVTQSLPSKQPGVLTNMSASAPQNVTPAPQKSSIPPSELTALSAYEQIKTRMQHQEAIEGQALKNLAMALKLGGSSHSALFGTKPGAAGQAVRTHELCSFSSRRDGNKLASTGSHPELLPQELVKPDRKCQSIQQIGLKESISGISPRNFRNDLVSGNIPGKAVQPSADCSTESDKIVRKCQNMQPINIKEQVSGVSPRNFKSDLVSYRFSGKNIHQKSAAYSAQGSGRNATVPCKISQPLEHLKMVPSLSRPDTNKVTKKKPLEKSFQSAEIQVAQSNDANVAKLSETLFLKSQTKETGISRFLPQEKDILSQSLKLHKSSSSSPKHPDSTKVQAQPSSHSERLPVNGAFSTNKTSSSHLISTSSTLSHKNIFTEIERSIPEHILSSHAAKIKVSSDAYSNRNVSSLSENLLLKQTVKVPSLALPQKTTLPYSRSELVRAETVRQVNTISPVPAPVTSSRYSPAAPDTSSRCSPQSLKECITPLQDFLKTQSLSPLDIINDRKDEVAQPQRSKSSTEVRRQDQDADVKSSKKGDNS